MVTMPSLRLPMGLEMLQSHDCALNSVPPWRPFARRLYRKFDVETY